ncbi:MAG: hypothetical protein COV45_00120 [Deltaproteobacteria bacterium CG11_big_fil_rev_8_21_14_0_20_47_16]|nr:MAG: hypothetical protein COV45_00120 [Deltaproteobacteria bacterium CG11_big_fil_rev_8_21_14_0_20_47_16]
MKNSSGISVVEIIGVMALLGILGLAAVVLVPSGYPARLDAASKQVQSDIEHVRQLAMSTTVTHGIQFVAGGDYTAYQTDISTPILSPLTHLDMITTLGNKYPGVSIQTNYTVEFDDNGAPTVGAGGFVTISNSSGSKNILVTAGTGSVVIQ